MAKARRGEIWLIDLGMVQPEFRSSRSGGARLSSAAAV